MIAARAQLPPESFHFFLRRQLLSIITRYIKSKHLRYAYISLESIPTLSYTQLTPVGDGHRSPCLVTSRADEHKRPIYVHTHTPRAALDIYKKILSIFTSNKIQIYHNKMPDPIPPFRHLLEPWLGSTYFLFCLRFPYMDSLIVCPN